MASRNYLVCGHCGKNKHNSEFTFAPTSRRGLHRRCDGCVDMIAKALKAQEGDPAAVPDKPIRNSTMTELYKPPQWGNERSR